MPASPPGIERKPNLFFPFPKMVVRYEITKRGSVVIGTVCIRNKTDAEITLGSYRKGV